MSGRFEVVETETVRRVNSDLEKPGFLYHDEEVGSGDDTYEGDKMHQFTPLARWTARMRGYAESQYSNYQTFTRQNQLWRYLAPLSLLCSVILFFALFSLEGASPLSASPILAKINPSLNSKLALETLECPSSYHAHRIAKDDNCWDIATIKGTSVEGLVQANPGLNCDKLEIGGEVCVPGIPEDSRVISKLHVIGENIDEADYA